MTAIEPDAVLAENLTPIQAAAIADVSERTFLRWINSGLLPARKVPGTRRVTVKKSDLEKFLAGVPVVPQSA